MNEHHPSTDELASLDVRDFGVAFIWQRRDARGQPAERLRLEPDKVYEMPPDDRHASRYYRYMSAVPVGGVEIPHDEVIKLIPGGVLEPVDYYNARKRRERAARDEAASCTGVACPKCGGELKWGPFDCGSVSPIRRTTRTAYCNNCYISVELET